jgi:hypothetical protein
MTSWWRGANTLVGSAGAIAGIIFPNRLLSRFAQEQARAQELGARPVSPGESGFEEVLGSNDTIKWAVLEDNSLVIMPKYINGEEVFHSILSDGQGVKAAGEAQIAQVEGEAPFGITINRLSGHFYPSEESLQLGIQAFNDAGITFAEVDPGVPGS